jgi:uncharacterized repeat protein (TIGR03803 family)
VKKRTWSLLRRILPGVFLTSVVAGQFVCAAARGNEQVLKSFGPTDDAGAPMGGLIEDANGVLYGASLRGGTGGTVFAINPDGSGFKVLHFFGSGVNDATNPVGPLVLGVDGAVYGISGGGAKGLGAIFTLRLDGTGYRVLYSFGTVPQDGTSPQAPLTQLADGTLSGVTYSGGGSNVGAVFAVRADGTDYRLLHSFEGSPNDGANPQGGLMLGKDGALYGTTSLGGTNNNGPAGFPAGTVFKLNADGTSFALLHSFNGQQSDGANPSGALLQGGDGALYGTSRGSGPGNFDGNLFRLNPNGSGYVVLHTFPRNAQYAVPLGGLVQGPDGSLYGVTGAAQANGSVFKLNPDGTGYAVLHVFSNLTGDGWEPNDSLLLGIDGALYGTTYYGGNAIYQLGTVFRVTTPTPAPSFVMSIVPAAGGNVHIGFVGVVGTTYGLYSSTNLVDWIIQGTVSNETGVVQFLDWNVARSPQRFYRAMSLP